MMNEEGTQGQGSITPARPQWSAGDVLDIQGTAWEVVNYSSENGTLVARMVQPTEVK